MGRFRPRGNPTQRMIGRAVSHGMRGMRYQNSPGCGCLTIIIILVFAIIFLK